MRVNNFPSTQRIQGLLAECRRQVAAIAAREEQLEREFVRRRAALARTLDQAQAQLEAETTLRRQADTNAHQAALARAHQRHQSRKERIQKAQVECRRRAKQQLDKLDGREVFGFQKGTLDSERNRDAKLASASAALAAHAAAASETTETLASKEAALRSRFGGFRLFKRWLSPAFPWPSPDLALDEHESLKRAQSALAEVDTVNRQGQRSVLLTGFRWVPLWLFCGLIVAVVAGAFLGLPYLGRTPAELRLTSALAGGSFVLYLTVRIAARHRLRSLAERGAHRLSDARHWLASAIEKAEARHQFEIARITEEYAETNRNIRERWSRHEETLSRLRADSHEAVSRKTARATAKNERLFSAALARLEQHHDAEFRASSEQISERRAARAIASQVEMTQLEEEYKTAWSSLVADWQLGVGSCAAFLSAAAALESAGTPPWTADYWRNWEPPLEYSGPARIGTLLIDVHALASRWPVDPRLAFPGPGSFSLPFWLAYPEESSVIIETDSLGAEAAGSVLNNIAYGLLCRLPPGRLKVTILDPVGLGKNFANLMHLADYSEAQGGAGQRIWTEPAQIEERLAELTEHLEKVIQMYLRDEFTNLVEYNAHAGSIAEHHHLLIVMGFPVNFSDSAARRLLNLITNGGRCGIITLLNWDRRHPVPTGFVADELGNAGVRLVGRGTEFTTLPPFGAGVHLSLDRPPPPELATELLHRIGRGSRDANRVVVPFGVVAPLPEAIWSETTLEEIRVPIGRTGASKLQYLSLGRGTRQHALISGKTGSGKSNLLHVIVTNLSLRCSPAEMEFYLVDFKKGVEFKTYATARLPHARVVAIESDREFGLSVLERLDQELRRRGELFRHLGVQNLPGYRQAGGQEPMPRCLLLVDEFQEYFVQEDRVSQNAAVLLDRIVRQGRAFGIHVILASQTLGGTYALARATLGQMAVRIAFHCDEADAYLIMGDDNPAPRLLSRPGEGIYNDAAGALEANSPFQAVWLPDELRDQYLAAICERNARSPWSQAAPVVFEGSAPANIEENSELRQRLLIPPEKAPLAPTAWLGAPNSIKGPTAAVFSRASGSNLLIVGQREESSLSLAISALISLAAQHPAPLIRFVLVDTTPTGTPRGDILARLAAQLPDRVECVSPGQLPTALATLAAGLDDRMINGGQDKPNVFLILVGLQHCKKLKPDDSFSFSTEATDPALNASATFQKLYIEGPPNGIHTIALFDSYNNVNRFLGRKGLSEFEMRVLLQMSASDSSSLIDQPAAASLGLYGALFYNDREGRLELFRPYSLPEDRWVAEVGERLKRRP